MSKEGWGGKRANSGRHKVTQKVKHLRLPVLAPRNIEEELAINWFRSLKPTKRLIMITEVAKHVKDSKEWKDET